MTIWARITDDEYTSSWMAQNLFLTAFLVVDFDNEDVTLTTYRDGVARFVSQVPMEDDDLGDDAEVRRALAHATFLIFGVEVTAEKIEFKSHKDAGDEKIEHIIAVVEP